MGSLEKQAESEALGSALLICSLNLKDGLIGGYRTASPQPYNLTHTHQALPPAQSCMVVPSSDTTCARKSFKNHCLKFKRGKKMFPSPKEEWGHCRTGREESPWANSTLSVNRLLVVIVRQLPQHIPQVVPRNWTGQFMYILSCSFLAAPWLQLQRMVLQVAHAFCLHH